MRAVSFSVCITETLEHTEIFSSCFLVAWEDTLWLELFCQALRYYVSHSECGVSGEVGITRCGLGVRVTEELANDW